MLAKRVFDLVLSAFLLLIFGWIIIIFMIGAGIDTRSNGIFMQDRVGQFGRLFRIYKLRSIGENHGKNHISSYGRFIRKTKIDELPQLINVLIGNMSFVGPRPDISGYYDLLTGDERKILELKPGLTSEAALKYLDEETMLATHPNPQQYNDEVLFRDKIRMNLDYYCNRSFFGDIRIIAVTVLFFLKIGYPNLTSKGLSK